MKSIRDRLAVLLMLCLLVWGAVPALAAFLHKGRLLLCEEKDALREEYALWHGTAAQLAALDVRVYGCLLYTSPGACAGLAHQRDYHQARLR